MTLAIVGHGGYRVRVQTRGPAHGPHAIVLPGMGETGFVLAAQIRHLRDLGYTTHLVELPGFGVGPALRKETARFDQLADLVLSVAKSLGIDEALLLGHSLGGGIALHLAVRRPDFVTGLVLIAPAAVGRSLVWTYKLFCLPLVGRALLRPYRRGSARYLRYFLLGRRSRNDARLIERLVKRDARAPLKARSMRAIVWANQPSILRRLTLLALPGGEQLAYMLGDRLWSIRDIPTLVLWGSDDRVISARDAEAFRRASPKAEVAIARGIGHLLPLEAAAWANGHIGRFVARAVASPAPSV